MKFTDLLFFKFCISVKEKHPTIPRKVIKIVLYFSTSYLCEQALSCLIMSIKNKNRNHLIVVENEICECQFQD